jgi:hypothetical protein
MKFISLTLINALNVSAGLNHLNVLRFAQWIVAFLTLITRKHGSNCWKSGASYTPVRLRLPLKIKLFKHFRLKSGEKPFGVVRDTFHLIQN